MKISELTTEEALDAMCELTPYVSGIISDKELMNELKRKVDAGEDASRAEFIALALEKLTVIVPMLLKKRRTDVCGILGILNRKDAAAVASQNILVTLAQVREISKDRELIDFSNRGGMGKRARNLRSFLSPPFSWFCAAFGSQGTA